MINIFMFIFTIEKTELTECFNSCRYLFFVNYQQVFSKSLFIGFSILLILWHYLKLNIYQFTVEYHV